VRDAIEKKVYLKGGIFAVQFQGALVMLLKLTPLFSSSTSSSAGSV
jgi:hypothetical protein